MPAQQPPCPDFTLAPLKALPPKVLDPTNQVDQFVLVLALVFNDLKAIMWLMTQANKCKSDPIVVSGQNGQALGFGIYVSRQLLGLTHELLLKVKKAEDAGILADKTFQKAVALAPQQAQDDWKAITVAAQQDATTDDLRKYLRFARNKAAFHYDTDHLAQGYSDHFEGRVPGVPPEGVQHAYVSLGESMEETRFYFADAAAAAVYTKVLDNSGHLFGQADKFGERINKALSFVVRKFLLLKQ